MSDFGTFDTAHAQPGRVPVHARAERCVQHQGRNIDATAGYRVAMWLTASEMHRPLTGADVRATITCKRHTRWPSECLM